MKHDVSFVFFIFHGETVDFQVPNMSFFLCKKAFDGHLPCLTAMSRAVILHQKAPITKEHPDAPCMHMLTYKKKATGICHKNVEKIL